MLALGELLEQLGWSDELLRGCERIAAALNAGLPIMEGVADEPCEQLVVSGDSIELFHDPVATESLYFSSRLFTI